MATLALGIGAHSAVVSLMDAVLLRPLGYLEPERLVCLWGSNPAQNLPVVPASPVGRVIQLDGGGHTVVGILQPEFQFPFGRVEAHRFAITFHSAWRGKAMLEKRDENVGRPSASGRECAHVLRSKRLARSPQRRLTPTSEWRAT